MKLSKVFVTSAAAVSVVGAIGFAYAQTYNPTPPTSNPQTQPEVQSPVQTSPADTNTPSQTQRRATTTGTPGSMNDNTRMSSDNSNSSMDNNSERMARADRN